MRVRVLLSTCVQGVACEPGSETPGGVNKCSISTCGRFYHVESVHVDSCTSAILQLLIPHCNPWSTHVVLLLLVRFLLVRCIKKYPITYFYENSNRFRCALHYVSTTCWNMDYSADLLARCDRFLTHSYRFACSVV
jgi:hypothetical protein